VDACSSGAVPMSQDYELSSYDKQQLIYPPEHLTSSHTASGRARFIISKNEACHRE